MITRQPLAAITVASTCLWPLAALAQSAPPATAPTVPATAPAAPPAAAPVMVPGGASSWADAMALATPPTAAPAWAPTWALPPLPPLAMAPATPPAVNPEPLLSYLPPPTGEVEFGAGGVAGHNPYYAGRYTGLNTGGADLVAQFDLGYRYPGDSGGSGYYEVFGNNLVFQTGNSFDNHVTNSLANAGSLGLNFGEQGTWESQIGFRSIPYTGNIIDSLYTMYGSHGVLNPGLTPFGGASPTMKGPITSFTVPGLNATGAEQPFLVGTRRDIVDGNFNYIWGDWTFTGAFNHQHKQGSLEESY